MCASVICGTAAGGFTFAFVLRIAKVFTSWSDTRLMPDIVGTHFLLEALRRDPFRSVYTENPVGMVAGVVEKPA